MKQNTYKKYINIFMCLAIASILVLPVSANNSAFIQTSSCIDNSSFNMAMSASMSVKSESTCAEMDICDTDLCAGNVCSSAYLFALPENHDPLIALSSYTGLFSFVFVTHPEPLGSFQRPPISS